MIAAYDHALVSPKYSDGVLKALEVEAMLTDNDPAGYADRALSAYQAHRGERR